MQCAYAFTSFVSKQSSAHALDHKSGEKQKVIRASTDAATDQDVTAIWRSINESHTVRHYTLCMWADK